MSQQVAAGQGGRIARRDMTAGREGKPRFQFRSDSNGTTKAFKSTIAEIANDMFNTGQNKFAVQSPGCRLLALCTGLLFNCVEKTSVH